MTKGPQKKTPELELEMEKYRSNYGEWKENNIRKKEGFFPIYNSFKFTHLSKISGGALKAYIYLGLHSHNKTGECWHSIEKISEFFQVDERTTKKWLAELEDFGLIVRIQKGFRRIANTFLVPYSLNEKD
jgi:hypothetical protein